MTRPLFYDAVSLQADKTRPHVLLEAVALADQRKRYRQSTLISVD